MNNSLSVIIITHNEAHDLNDCLASVQRLSPEIIVVDSGSTDDTVKIAKQWTSHVFFREFDGYSSQKQFALENASGDWILNIDADERVSPELVDEIKAALSDSNQKNAGFRIPFDHYFLGKHLRFGRLGKETHVRLFKREISRYGKEKVHEGILVDGSIGQLNGYIVHRSYASIHEYLQKCNEYTTAIANKKFACGERFSSLHHFRLPYEFLMRYVFKLGFLDGIAGLTYAVLSSYYVWLKFVKLKDIEEGRLR